MISNMNTEENKETATEQPDDKKVVFHFYRLPADTEVGKKLSQYLHDSFLVRVAAGRLAEELGAVAWAPSALYEEGGIDYLQMPALGLSKAKYSPVQGFADDDDKRYVWCEPNVKETVKWCRESDAPQPCQRVIVEHNPDLRLLGVEMTRERLAEVVGVELYPKAVMEGKHLVTPDGERHDLSEVVDTNSSKAIREAVATLMKPWRDIENERLTAAVKEAKLVRTVHLAGAASAVRVQRKLMALPFLRHGSINAVLGMATEYRPRFFLLNSEGAFCVELSEPWTCTDAVEVTESEFETRKALFSQESAESVSGGSDD